MEASIIVQHLHMRGSGYIENIALIDEEDFSKCLSCHEITDEYRFFLRANKTAMYWCFKTTYWYTLRNDHLVHSTNVIILT